MGSKVKVDVLKPWITKRTTEMLKIEDDVVVEFIFNQLEEQEPDPRKMQINLTGFLNGKYARMFMGELWTMLDPAQNSENGIPAELVNMKMDEIKERKGEDARMAEGLRKLADSMGAEAERERQRERGDRSRDRSRDRERSRDGGRDKERRRSRSRERRGDRERRRNDSEEVETNGDTNGKPDEDNKPKRKFTEGEDEDEVEEKNGENTANGATGAKENGKERSKFGRSSRNTRSRSGEKIKLPLEKRDPRKKRK